MEKQLEKKISRIKELRFEIESIKGRVNDINIQIKNINKIDKGESDTSIDYLYFRWSNKAFKEKVIKELQYNKNKFYNSRKQLWNKVKAKNKELKCLVAEINKVKKVMRKCSNTDVDADNGGMMCSICCDTVESICVYECGHWNCEKCFLKLIDKPCPICRKKIVCGDVRVCLL